MGQVISLFNMSGGVGKSTLAMNLGYHLTVELDQRVLLIDMDPQASLTTFMGLSPFELKATIFNSLVDEAPLAIDSESQEWDLVPANIYLAQAEMKLAAELRREYRLADALRSVDSDYDLILIDCPPSLGLLSVNCLVAAHYLVIPIQTEYKSVEATINLLRTTYEIAQKVNPTLKIAGAVPTMHNQRLSQSQRALTTITEVFESLRGNPSFKDTEIFAPIPRRTDFANAVAEHVALAQYDPKHSALATLREIAKTLGELL
jgi:chromosome partitioning protein